jgi:hypothetical protein
MWVEGTVRRAAMASAKTLSGEISVKRLILRPQSPALFSRQKEVVFGVVPFVR